MPRTGQRGVEGCGEGCAKACAKQSVKPLVRWHIAEGETWI